MKIIGEATSTDYEAASSFTKSSLDHLLKTNFLPLLMLPSFSGLQKSLRMLSSANNTTFVFSALQGHI